jgi:hypothetical protein
VKTRNGREQAQIGNNNKSVVAENREQSRTIRNFETCSFRRLLAVTRQQFAFCVADPVRPVQTRWQFDSSERPQKICVNLRNLWINPFLSHQSVQSVVLCSLSQFVAIFATGRIRPKADVVTERNGTKCLIYTLVYSKKYLTLSVETAITTHLRVRTPLNNLNPKQNIKPQNKTSEMQNW